jgi:catechol 2,3-dioxygenase-like lactoylglutathione lyase family enzyme
MMTTDQQQDTKTYDVGGVLLPRPFKIRRLGHLGLNLERLDEALTFYTDVLGFRVTDELNVLEKVPDDAREIVQQILTDPRLIFTTHGSDHHALVLAHKTFGTLWGNDRKVQDITFSQLTFQVGSLQEVIDAEAYLRERGVEIGHYGRDMPGSNWEIYAYDPDDNMIELYYGIEQIGWQRKSKPYGMHYRGFNDEMPSLPQMSEAAEVREAQAKGIDTDAGYHPSEKLLEETHVVGGVLLPRPFKVTGIGPVSLFTERMDEMIAFYTGMLGFEVIEEVELHGRRIVYFRTGTEHHTFALADKALRSILELSEHTSCLSIGLQVGGFTQLRDAAKYLMDHGYELVHGLPQEIYVGIDYAVHLKDPDGHLICLYYYMEQIGWDGKPRPQSERRAMTLPWPETLEALSDTYGGTAYLGPLG